MDPSDRPSFIAIARIVRTRGNRGEVLAELHTDFPSRFGLLRQVWLEYPDGRHVGLTLEEAWVHKGRQVLKFDGIDSISAAETLVGAWVQIEAGERAPLPEGAYWDADLVGCVLRNEGGTSLGVVVEVMRIAGNSQFVVRDGVREYLVPAVAAICREISIARKEILVDLPEGLMDLNR